MSQAEWSFTEAQWTAYISQQARLREVVKVQQLHVTKRCCAGSMTMVEPAEGGIDKNPSVELLFIEHFHGNMDANVYEALNF